MCVCVCERERVCVRESETALQAVRVCGDTPFFSRASRLVAITAKRVRVSERERVEK